MSVRRRKISGKLQKTWTARFMHRGAIYRRSGFPDKDTAQHWHDSTRLALKRGDVGYVKIRTAAKMEPLIQEFEDHLATRKCTDKYILTSRYRLLKMAREIPWMTLADFTAGGFESWRGRKPKWKKKVISPRSLNQYLATALQFGDWLVKYVKLLPANPMLNVAKVLARSNKHYRRAASLEELNKLLTHAPADRALVYRFLIYVPLRRAAMLGIEWRDLELAGERPTLTLRAELSKSRHEAKLAIPGHLVKLLAEHRGDASPADHVFKAVPTIDELKLDLQAAGVPFSDAAGQRRLDLHAFRKTAIRILKSAGVSLDEAHVFLQHRSRQTTEMHYDDDMVAPEISTAAEKMPEIGGGR